MNQYHACTDIIELHFCYGLDLFPPFRPNLHIFCHLNGGTGPLDQSVKLRYTVQDLKVNSEKSLKLTDGEQGTIQIYEIFIACCICDA